MEGEMRLVACTHEGHAESILDILNEAIENSTAIYDYRSTASLLNGRLVQDQDGWRVSGHRR